MAARATLTPVPATPTPVRKSGRRRRLWRGDRRHIRPLRQGGSSAFNPPHAGQSPAWTTHASTCHRNSRLRAGPRDREGGRRQLRGLRDVRPGSDPGVRLGQGGPPVELQGTPQPVPVPQAERRHHRCGIPCRLGVRGPPAGQVVGRPPGPTASADPGSSRGSGGNRARHAGGRARGAGTGCEGRSPHGHLPSDGVDGDRRRMVEGGDRRRGHAADGARHTAPAAHDVPPAGDRRIPQHRLPVAAAGSRRTAGSTRSGLVVAADGLRRPRGVIVSRFRYRRRFALDPGSRRPGRNARALGPEDTARPDQGRTASGISASRGTASGSRWRSTTRSYRRARESRTTTTSCWSARESER